MTPPYHLKKSIALLTSYAPLPDFSHVIWDVDGTILNSEPIHAKSVIKTCAEQGICIAETELHQFLGKSHFDTYSKILEHTTYNRPFDEFLNNCIAYYAEHLDEIEMRLDVLDVIHMLDGEGILQSIFSNNPGSIVFPTAAIIEKRIGKKGFFQQIISLDGTQAIPHEIKRKPDPDGYLFALDLLETTADQCIVIEDSPTGTKAGNGAGIFTIGWAHGNEESLEEAGSNLIVGKNLMEAFNGIPKAKQQASIRR